MSVILPKAVEGLRYLGFGVWEATACVRINLQDLADAIGSSDKLLSEDGSPYVLVATENRIVLPRNMHATCCFGPAEPYPAAREVILRCRGATQ